jgi:hypothetical protein
MLEAGEATGLLEDWEGRGIVERDIRVRQGLFMGMFILSPLREAQEAVEGAVRTLSMCQGLLRMGAMVEVEVLVEERYI